MSLGQIDVPRTNLERTVVKRTPSEWGGTLWDAKAMYSPVGDLALQTAKCLIELLLRSLFRGVIDTAKSKWYNMTIK